MVVDSQEIHNYPHDPIIKFKQSHRSFSYNIIKEGSYPTNELIFAYTSRPGKYKIPDEYIIETTWGKGNNKCVIKCLIDYVDDKPNFQIKFGRNFENEVSSFQSATDATNLFHNVVILSFLNYKSFNSFVIN
jgi:hypothetical protein